MSHTALVKKSIYNSKNKIKKKEIAFIKYTVKIKSYWQNIQYKWFKDKQVLHVNTSLP